MAKKKQRPTSSNLRSKSRVTIPGSERRTVAGAKVVGAVDPHQQIEITVQLRPRRGSKIDQRMSKVAANLLDKRQYLTREELEKVTGADPADVASVDAFAHQQNLTVTEVSIPRRTIKLAGSIADLSAAFGVKLKRYHTGGITYRGRTGPIYVPKELAGVVERVLGLDDRPVVTTHYRIRHERKSTTISRDPGQKKPRVANPSANAGPHSFKPTEVAKLYNFPTGRDGKGQTIGLIELNDVDKQGNAVGVGYAKADLDAFFAGLGLPTPNTTPVGVDGGANVPGPDPNGDGEVTLDIEVAGAVAPGANLVVYFGTNTTDGFIQALTTAIHDNIRKPSIISISWGGPEESSTSQLLTGLEQALKEAALLGITICAAAGDDGSADMQKKDWDNKPHADFPASSSYALACGGTMLLATNTGINEAVWNRGSNGGATGGGVSNVFAKPAYQKNIKVPRPQKSSGGRGLPDISGNADPATGYEVVVGGKATVIGGTSAVAPLWAGLLALINEDLTSKGRNQVGFFNPLLYGKVNSAKALHDIVNGNNDIYGDLKGKYPAGKGWDACTGLGTPDGSKVLAAI